MKKLANYRKALVAAAGVLAQIVNAGLVSGGLGHNLAILLAVLTAVGVHQAPNEPST